MLVCLITLVNFSAESQAFASALVEGVALHSAGWELTRAVARATSRQGRVMALLRATALALALGSANAGGAYPDLSGGASYIKLTDATFDSFINDALAAGKTAMVRWIASEG